MVAFSITMIPGAPPDSGEPAYGLSPYPVVLEQMRDSPVVKEICSRTQAPGEGHAMGLLSHGSIMKQVKIHLSPASQMQ